MPNRNALFTLAVFLYGVLLLGACGGARASEHDEEPTAHTVQADSFASCRIANKDICHAT